MAATDNRTEAAGSRVVVYRRVSSTAQDGPDSYGLDVQLADCKRYAERMGLTVVAVLTDVVSGTNGIADRTALPEAVGLLDAGVADGVLAANASRIARTLTTAEGIYAAVWARDCAVHLADTGLVQKDDPNDPMRTALRQVAGVFAELDRGMVAKRLADGRRAKRAAGGYGGGFRAEVAADVDALALALRRDGKSWRGVAAALDESGHRPPSGGAWAQSTVRTMVRRAERAERGRALAKTAPTSESA